LEEGCGPMKEVMFSFNLHDWEDYLYPQGGSGWIFSNYAAQLIWKNVEAFHKVCDGAFDDDVAIAPFLKTLGINLTDYQRSRSVVYWPEQQFDPNDVMPCPERYRLLPGTMPFTPVPVRDCVSLHMHRIPMNQSYERLKNVPDHIAVAMSGSRALFCAMK